MVWDPTHAATAGASLPGRERVINTTTAAEPQWQREHMAVHTNIWLYV